MKDKILELESVAKCYSESVLSKASKNQFCNFFQWIPVKLGLDVQNEFIQLYELANGFEFNGLIIYSLDKQKNNNIYDLNDEWHDNGNMEKYLFIGDADISWFCYSYEDENFYELEKPSGRPMKKFTSLVELVNSSISNII